VPGLTVCDADVERRTRALPPPGYEVTRSTPVFTEATVPPGLLRSHRTAPGTWGLIRVLEGRLLYRVLDPASERVLDAAGAPGLVEPGVPHEVAPLGPVRFLVEFYRMRGAAVDVAAPAPPSSAKGQSAMSRSVGRGDIGASLEDHRADWGRPVALVWAGMVLGVSFLATPAKFLAPSLPRPVALDAAGTPSKHLAGSRWR
jgi:tellurite resistance-related uncharacterized protein